MADSIQALYDQLKAQRDAYLAETAPLRAEVDHLRAELQPLEDKFRAASERLTAARDRAQFQAVSQQLAKLGRIIEDQSGAGPTRVTLQAEGSAPTTTTPGKVG